MEVVGTKLGLKSINPEFEDNAVVMDENEPSSAQAHEKREKAKAEKAAKMPTAEEASQVS